MNIPEMNYENEKHENMNTRPKNSLSFALLSIESAWLVVSLIVISLKFQRQHHEGGNTALSINIRNYGKVAELPDVFLSSLNIFLETFSWSQRRETLS